MPILRYSLFLALLALCWSCQTEDGLTTLPQPQPELQVPIQPELGTPAVAADIAASDWWAERSAAERELLAGELAAAPALSFTDIQTQRLSAVQRFEKRGRTSVCAAGFPANPAGDVTLNSQADVDAFGALKCKDIVGALVVVDTLGPDPICSLSPLNKLQSVGSSVTTALTCATSLNGLDKLKSIGELGPFGFIGVRGDNLTDIEALRKLKVITGTINIISNPQLTTITDAFSKISSIDSTVTPNSVTTFSLLNINNNALLTDLSGFRNISFIAGGLRIINNAALTDLDDLSSLDQINEDIFIFDNPALTQVDALSPITSLADDLFVSNNPALTQCCGLYNLLCADAPACTDDAVGDLVIIIDNGCTEADIVAGGPCAP